MNKWPLILLFLPMLVWGGGPKYTYPYQRGLDDEMQNIYHDIKNPSINNGNASTMTITNLIGTKTNDSAAIGNIGEYVESVVGGTSLTTNVYQDLTSISLTSGDWDITGIVVFARNGATYTDVDHEIGISVYSGNNATGLVLGSNYEELYGIAPISFTYISASIPSYRVSISGTTIFYLKTYTQTVTVGTVRAQGRLSARRVR